MATFKIKLEDKAAFLNRMEKAGAALDTDQAVDNKLEGYFEVIVDEPKQLEAVKTILKQSPKINTIQEMENKKKLTKSELKEMVRQELQAVIAEKKKVKGEDKKDKLDENEEVSENLMADAAPILATLLGVGGSLAAAIINDLRKAKTPEEKKRVLQSVAGQISKSKGL
jgi:hypothetical protein